MNKIRYVLLDPTGNLTCLVTDPVPPDVRSAVTDILMDRCEQVGYLTLSGEVPRLEMMGGEFCGNAAMACAAYLAEKAGAAGDTAVRLSVSGAEGAVECSVRPLSPGLWEGRVAMPPVRGYRHVDLGGRTAALVSMEGIAHLIMEGPPLEKAEAETLLLKTAPALPEEAVGLLQWDGDFMRPLVLVKKSGTLVWENGCGSGSTALCAHLALSRGVKRIAVRQPGGTILAEAETCPDGNVRVSITGSIRFRGEGNIPLP
ncbi:MAG: hypothetical protein IKP22_01470 [Clostridia bacterium]|nr:hypothetical protein [Clostridia bacterium]